MVVGHEPPTVHPFKRDQPAAPPARGFTDAVVAMYLRAAGTDARQRARLEPVDGAPEHELKPSGRRP